MWLRAERKTNYPETHHWVTATGQGLEFGIWGSPLFGDLRSVNIQTLHPSPLSPNSTGSLSSPCTMPAPHWAEIQPTASSSGNQKKTLKSFTEGWQSQADPMFQAAAAEKHRAWGRGWWIPSAPPGNKHIPAWHSQPLNRLWASCRENIDLCKEKTLKMF